MQNDVSGLHASVISLEDRLRDIEARVCMEADPRAVDVEFLSTAYIMASTPHDLDAVSIQLWALLTRVFSTYGLLLLARHVKDPFPWRPFLAILNTGTTMGVDTTKATERLLRIAQELLNLQGLELVRPGDVMASRLQVQAAISAIS